MGYLIKNQIFVFLICFAFNLRSCEYEKADLLSQTEKMLNQFVAKAEKKIGKQYGMSPFGTGGGIKDGIWLMSPSFQLYGKSLNEYEARKLIINCLLDFLKLVNNDENLKPFLKEYPFTFKNIDLTIYFYNFLGKKIFHPYISVVSAHEGKIGYFTDNKRDPYAYESEKYETYDEAIAILQKEQLLEEIR